jgi:hypothetical protein
MAMASSSERVKPGRASGEVGAFMAELREVGSVGKISVG